MMIIAPAIAHMTKKDIMTPFFLCSGGKQSASDIGEEETAATGRFLSCQEASAKERIVRSFKAGCARRICDRVTLPLAARQSTQRTARAEEYMREPQTIC